MHSYELDLGKIKVIIDSVCDIFSALWNAVFFINFSLFWTSHLFLPHLRIGND